MTVAAAQANVDSAQLSVTSAEKALAATTLRAPMAGTVTAVNGAVGTTVSGGGSSSVIVLVVVERLGRRERRRRPRRRGGELELLGRRRASSSFIMLAQLSRFKLEVALSESDIGKVKVGQSATVTVNAASGEEVAAHVTTSACSRRPRSAAPAAARSATR